MSEARANALVRGFTLPEVIIASLVSAVVGVLLLSILVNNTSVSYKESSKVLEGLDSNQALMSIRGGIKESQAIVASYPITGTPIYTSGPTQLILRLASIDSAGGIIDNTFDYSVFYISNENFHQKILPDILSQRQSADKVISKYVNDVYFQYLDSTGTTVSPPAAAKVRVTLTLQQKSGSSIVTNVATTEANIRND